MFLLQFLALYILVITRLFQVIKFLRIPNQLVNIGLLDKIIDDQTQK